MKESILGFMAGIFCFVMLAIGGCPSTTKMARPHAPGIKLMEDSTTVVPVPNPRHIEWDRYHVGGLVLVNPAVTDTTGGAQWMRLPAGTMLLIPRWVDGPAPMDPRFET